MDVGDRQTISEWVFGRTVLEQVDSQVAGIVVMLDNQSRIDSATVRRLATEGTAPDIVVCRYEDGISDLSGGQFGPAVTGRRA
ncbi:hypothetical protein [Mycobacterium leprae]|uniref:hypothetical protein n=1 Tax=Mycobacterium leprae TaxID=1769 RepID=UPI0006741B28|nr:hypothetical protein [Mycobacterium leprae]OAR20507.1 hypothetical protein A8144_02510 [Mycobacterium leprae 3125609]OAX72034.1 hypothetical protein A3216_02285 [Mycobacterium leprae 7935681]